MTEGERETGRETADSRVGRRPALPESEVDGGIPWWRTRFRDAGLERTFQHAHMAATRQYLILLALAGFAGALLTTWGAWLELSAGAAALWWGTAWRVGLALAAAGVIIYCRVADQPWQLYACNALVLAIGYVAVALRSSAPVGPEAEITLFHVTQNGITLLLIVSVAQLTMVPGWFPVNAGISGAALAAYVHVMHNWHAPPTNARDITYVGLIGFLFILGMGYSAQRLRRNSFFARIQLQRANEQLNRLATLDHLTGCANRRHFYSQAEAELSRSRRYNRDMGLVIMDVDHFKAINDQFGHAAGDAVLQTLVETLRRELRDLDVLGRIGGEEFALLLPETDRGEALQIAERLRQRLADLRIEHDDQALSLTASFGVTAREPADRKLDSMMRRADRALYEAKAAGRDRTAVADSNRAAFIAKG